MTDYLQKFCRKAYPSNTKTSRATATRDLQDLVKKKALIQKGELKGARYYLNLAH